MRPAGIYLPVGTVFLSSPELYCVNTAVTGFPPTMCAAVSALSIPIVATRK